MNWRFTGRDAGTGTETGTNGARDDQKDSGIFCVGEEARGEAIYDLDLVRLVISAEDLGLSGYQLADRLYEEYKIGMELSDDRYVVAVVTYANEESDMKRLARRWKTSAEKRRERSRKTACMLQRVRFRRFRR